MRLLTGVDVILKLLHFGSLKCLKTDLGETAHDIAVRKERSTNIVTLLKEPDVVTENREVIETVEEAVHKIIQERAGDRLRVTGAQLPQLAVLWEMSNECGEWRYLVRMQIGVRSQVYEWALK